MQIGAAFVAGGEAAEVVEPGEGAFDDVAGCPEAGSVRESASRDAVFDAARGEEAAVLVVVVAAVSVESRGLVAWTADPASHVRDAIQQRDELSDVVAVGGRGRVRQGCAVRVDDQVVLRARFAAVDWARARRGAPFFA